MKFEGEEWMDSKQGGKAQKSHAGAFSELVPTITVPSTSTSQKEKKKLVRHEHTVPLIKCITWRHFTGLSRVVYQATKAMAI